MSPSLNKFWANKVTGIALTHDEVGKLLFWTVMVELRPEATDALWEMDHIELASHFDELFGSVLWNELGPPLLHPDFLLSPFRSIP